MQCGINKQTSITYTFGSQFLSIFFFRGWGWGGEGWDVGFRGCVGATTSNLNGQYYRKSLIMFETMQKDKQTTDNTRLRCVYI